MQNTFNIFLLFPSSLNWISQSIHTVTRAIENPLSLHLPDFFWGGVKKERFQTKSISVPAYLILSQVKSKKRWQADKWMARKKMKNKTLPLFFKRQ